MKLTSFRTVQAMRWKEVNKQQKNEKNKKQCGKKLRKLFRILEDIRNFPRNTHLMWISTSETSQNDELVGNHFRLKSSRNSSRRTLCLFINLILLHKEKYYCQWRNMTSFSFYLKNYKNWNMMEVFHLIGINLSVILCY